MKLSLRIMSVLTGIGAALVFSLLYATDFFQGLENQIYDIFLGFRNNHGNIDNIVFVDVDDPAIAHIGVFPWPRSVVAEGLIKLKEYGARTVIFDIEYVDNSPTDVDEVYLKQGLQTDFEQSFTEVSSSVSELLGAIAGGQIPASDANSFSRDLADLIRAERDSLYQKTMAISRDNDGYLAQAVALFGNTWGTVNLQTDKLIGEQSERRPFAEEKFSYPIIVNGNIPYGDEIDVLAPLPVLGRAYRGAGYTNVKVDTDGIRRRIFLAKKVEDHWYLQLAFAPLINRLGRPDIEISPGYMTLKNVTLPGSGPKDVKIPLDKDGAMLINWPVTDYFDSFTHLSFSQLSYHSQYESELRKYMSALHTVDPNIFPDFIVLSTQAMEFFEQSDLAKEQAMAENSDEAFAHYLALRRQAFDLIALVLDSSTEALAETRNLATEYTEEAAWIRESVAGVDPEDPDRADALNQAEQYANTATWILDESGYFETVAGYLKEVHTLFEDTDRTLRETLPDKICIIGRVDTGTTDLGSNPFFGTYINVGTHGALLDTILSESFITPLSPLWSALVAFLFTPLIILAISRFKPGIRVLMGFTGVLVLLVLSLGLFLTKGIFLGPLGPVLAILATLIIRESIAFAGTEQEKQFIRTAFSRYLSPQVIEEIIKDPTKLNLGGETRELTAVFTDVRSFSTISQALKDPETNQPDPRKLVNLLNHYLTRMSDIVMVNGGTIDKYEGDAIIAFFGAPLEMENNAVAACKSVIEMKKAEIELNKEVIANGLVNQDVIDALLFKKIIKSPDEPPIFTRLGVNTGNMTVGNMGTPQKMDYTIMGNAVNLAARLEGVNKQYDTAGILISGETRSKIGESFITRMLDQVRVVGFIEPVRLYELMDTVENVSPEIARKVELFHHALNLFENRKWLEAQNAFEAVLQHDPDDGPTKIYLKRCKDYQENPPAEEWDGVYNLDQK
ncbi:guanylate cyclase [Spirochaetia bacterium]|nr:guanylate cyclase [Spirochaetia bacterium]